MSLNKDNINNSIEDLEEDQHPDDEDHRPQYNQFEGDPQSYNSQSQYRTGDNLVGQAASQVLQAREVGGDQYFARDFEDRRGQAAGVDAGDESPEGELFHDTYAPRRTSLYATSIESKQGVSGCIFGIIGSIVLGFGIYLVQKGEHSQRAAEIESYLNFVHEWTNQYQNQFQSLTFQIQTLKNETIPIEKDVGELTSEADIRYSLGRERRPSKQSLGERFRKGGKINEDDFQNGGRNLQQDFGDVDDEDKVITYHPVKFEKSFTPSMNQAFIEPIYTTEPSKYWVNIPLKINNEISLETERVQLLSQIEYFSKGGNSCKHGNGLGYHSRLNRCIFYFLVSKICVIVDKPDNEQWKVTGTCGVEHKQALPNSQEFKQEIKFENYPMTVEIRSAKDPHLQFGKLTHGTFRLDESPGGQIAAGTILLIFGIAMFAMSFYKSYRFCVKYTFKDYLARKRQQRYMVNN